MEKEVRKYDIVIIGGGPAGISCAYTAAKKGLKTLIVEKNNYLGGQITGALVVPMMKSSSDNINTDFYNDLICYAKKYNAAITYMDGNDGWFNPVLLKIVFDKMLAEAGVGILFETEFVKAHINEAEKNRILNLVEFCHKTLSIHIYSKYFVDATGDSNFCKFLNCNFIDDKSKNQPSSLRFIVSNINLEEFCNQIKKLDSDRNVTSFCKVGNDIHLSTAYTFDSSKKWGLAPIFEKALQAGDLKYSDTAYFQVFTLANMPNSLAFNCPRLLKYTDCDAFAFSVALIEAREAIFRIFNFAKKYFNGFENAFISQIADITGVRVSKRPKTRYIYKQNDIITGKTFDNKVLAADYPIDIHSNKKNASVLHMVKKYYLPIESLICADFDNLFVAGRNVGAEFEAQAALRIQKSCMSMGEGLAKYVCTLIKS